MAMNQAAGAREAAGLRVMHLEVGQPATGLPDTARRAVISALNSPLGYTNANGLSELRERLADRHTALGPAGSPPLDPSRIVVVAGASAGFTLAFLTLFEPGQRVGVIEPGYPCYRNALIALGIEAVSIPVGPESRWAPTAQHLSNAGHL
ncbi:MAG: aspartate/methionine/tyrosine aminotransferase, partial [Ilumatobacter sp.]